MVSLRILLAFFALTAELHGASRVVAYMSWRHQAWILDLEDI